MPPDLYGPFGALVFLGIAVAGLSKVIQALWKDHQRADVDDRQERDEWKALALASAHDNRRLAAAIEAALSIKVPPAP